jgi:hypothetical protein
MKEQALRQAGNLLKLFKLYPNKYQRDSLNRPWPTNRSPGATTTALGGSQPPTAGTDGHGKIGK